MISVIFTLQWCDTGLTGRCQILCLDVPLRLCEAVVVLRAAVAGAGLDGEKGQLCSENRMVRLRDC